MAFCVTAPLSSNYNWPINTFDAVGRATLCVSFDSSRVCLRKIGGKFRSIVFVIVLCFDNIGFAIMKCDCCTNLEFTCI